MSDPESGDRGSTQESLAEEPSGATGSRSRAGLELLARPELRPVRLQLDYLRAEVGLSDHGVVHTIVVFGSARLNDAETARQRVDEARAQLARNPESAELLQALGQAERSEPFSRYYEVSREFGALVGRAGEGPRDNRLVVVTGGGPGAMEAANRGASEVGAETIGLNISLPHEQLPNPYITPGLGFEFHYFAMRKLHFMLRARALVALPGGYGTLDELFETLCLVQTGKREPLPIVLVGRAFWEAIVDFEALVAAGMISPEDAELFVYAETAEEIWEHLTGWYDRRGESIFE